jgi:methylated-DNA-[protein]-cysteine S-methyltransferase
MAEVEFENHSSTNEKVLDLCQQELADYFAGKLKKFTVPLNPPQSTPFRMKVWDVLKTIPYGKTITYKELAVRIGNPKAIRAVGGANHHNPISIIVPCHRVIGANGSLTGFGGGLNAKEYLLKLESPQLNITAAQNGDNP